MRPPPPCYLAWLQDDVLRIIFGKLPFVLHKVALVSASRALRQLFVNEVRSALILPVDSAQELGISPYSTGASLVDVNDTARTFLCQSSMVRRLRLQALTNPQNLARALEVNASLTSLGLGGNLLGPEGAKALAPALAANASLTELNIADNNIVEQTSYIKASEVQGSSFNVGDKVLYQGREMVVSKAIDSDGEIKMSNLSGITAIADALRVSASLTEVDVRGNQLDKESATLLAKVATEKQIMLFGIKHDQKMADFRDNQLGRVDTILIANDLVVSASLTAANVLKNNLHADAVSTLLKVKQEHPKLTTLCGFKGDETSIDFWYHGLGPADAMLIAPEISVMASLTACNLLKNDFDVASAKALVEAVKDKDVSLCGIRPDETSTGVRFVSEGLKPPDAILLASDLSKPGVSASLTSLGLRNNHFMTEGGVALASGIVGSASLTEVDCRGNYFAEVGWCAIFDALRDNPQNKISRWVLSCEPINIAVVTSLASSLAVSASLTSLVLSYNNIKGSGKALGDALKTNSSLKELKIHRCKLDAEDGKDLADGIAAHASLTSLILCYNNLKGSGKALGDALKTNSSLKELNMRSCMLDAEDGKGLAGGLAVHASLTECSLRKNFLDDEDVEYIATALEESATSQLQKLDMCDNGVGPKGAAALAGYMADNASLTECNVCDHQLDKESATLLAGVATKKKVMLFGIEHDQTQASFYKRNLGLVDAILLANDMAVSASLRFVDFSRNRLQAEGAKTLAPGIASMVFVNLSFNCIGGYYDNLSRLVHTPEGPKAIADALRVTASLTKLDLAGNNLGPEGAKALAPALADNASLKSVSLASNKLCGVRPFDTTGIIAIADALRVNASLTQLNVYNNELYAESKTAIREAVRGKKGFELLI